MKKILMRRKAAIEARMKEIRADLEGDQTEASAVEQLQQEVDALTKELADIKAALEEDEEETEDEAEPPAGESGEGRTADDNGEAGTGENRSGLEPEKRNAIINNIMKSLSSESRTKAKQGEQRKAFANLLVGRISESEARAMGVETTNGKVLIPESLSKEIITYAQEENLLRKYGTRVQTEGQQGYPILVKKAKAQRVKKERTGDNPIPQTDIDFDEVFLSPSETDALVLVTKKLLAMSDMPVEQTVIEELKKAYVENEADYFFNSTENPGSLLQKAVPFTPAQMEVYDKLVRLKNTVPTTKLKASRWIMNRAALTAVETIKDKNGQPLLREAYIEGAFGYRILGYPVDVTDYVDGGTPDVPRLYFGDFSSFRIQDVINSMEVSKLLEKYSDTNQVGFKIWHLNDGQLVYGPYEPTVFKLELTDGTSA
ncbi:phage major capsid protein [Bacillus amyloliquefaciens]|uniref:phage major capsid protein n=1 Tax=Bacillus amyloliquefaciens TaxID=1390 RepID=UPI00293F63CA|nr:phage major capsid protein [Bacillus amyloliquefaciens]WOH96589.1 phage major capsid protein [Bacillus amyloliquefaciens]WOI51690.1 phage major capsid protein [Bacillus amyloliquefaciens]WOI67507.1 phage major capsid protein [Bacillus amyloliquefaciens]